VSAAISFEFFPPRTPEAEQRFVSVLERLAPLEPSFVSVTYGAGGSTRDSTLETLREIGARTAMPRAGHLTCVGCPREQVDATIRDYWDAGITHIVALRGDMPELGSAFAPHPDGYSGSVELVSAIRAIAPFEVSVSAYPETHPDSRSPAKDLELLARKADAGATRAITQFCFINERIVRLRDSVDRAGIAIPIVPGIMFASNLDGLARMADRCGTQIPVSYAQRFEGLDDDLHTRRLITAMLAVRQIEELRREGFEEFHLYTLNHAEIVVSVCRMAELTPQARERERQPA
jgi:methylenetetrahydrofolate reductase (NADPH)